MDTLQLNCDRYLAVDDTLIPTGTIVDVAGTPLDFRQRHAIGDKIAAGATKGYDHCYVVNGPAGTLRSCRRSHRSAERSQHGSIDHPTGSATLHSQSFGRAVGSDMAVCLDT